MRWTTNDFDALSWHDCSFYGFRLEEREHGTAELEFDIDYIVEWLCAPQRQPQFRVAPATLTFHNAFGLKFEVDYAAASAGMVPFSVSGIEREMIPYPGGHSSYRWRLPINWPHGVITFESPGFTQILRRPPLVVERQALLAHERTAG